METLFEIIDNNEYALFKADYSVAQCVLQDSATWGSQTLGKSGVSRWKVKVLLLINLYLFPSKIKPISRNSFLAKSFYLQHMNMAYSITRGEVDKTIIITPISYITPFRKIWFTLFLASLMVLPVLISPFLWKWAENYTYKFSKNHLEKFCLMLQKSIYLDENRIVFQDELPQ